MKRKTKAPKRKVKKVTQPNTIQVDNVKYVREDSIQQRNAPAPKGVFPCQVGDAMFVRTVTHHLTGRILDMGPDWIQLGEAAWIADDGRFNECLAKGTFNEVEPIPDWCVVGRGAIIDAFPWPHALPRGVK